MNRPPDFTGHFHLLRTSEGGRGAPAVSGYRPQHAIHDNYQTSGEHEYPDAIAVAPGEAVTARVRFITPEVYPACIWEGRTIPVLEGAKIVGTMTVLEIHNEALRCDASTFKPYWIEPKNLVE